MKPPKLVCEGYAQQHVNVKVVAASVPAVTLQWLLESSLKDDTNTKYSAEAGG